MTYSEEAIAFSQIPAGHQVRFEDRVSFLYLERCSVRQDKTGVVAYSKVEGESLIQRVQLPVSGLAVLHLGPGTSISAAAMTSCTRAGVTVMFTGGGRSAFLFLLCAIDELCSMGDCPSQACIIGT